MIHVFGCVLCYSCSFQSIRCLILGYPPISNFAVQGLLLARITLSSSSLQIAKLLLLLLLVLLMLWLSWVNSHRQICISPFLFHLEFLLLVSGYPGPKEGREKDGEKVETEHRQHKTERYSCMQASKKNVLRQTGVRDRDKKQTGV
ncbi:MAG: hypothetical protein J3R72DRAFT_439559 [Linnemannia gamsii]|nr:MAG: hypothetical protein J3R72DRAFT_439559 [Linnemannia gamsii]